jgi:hypothetical protein
VRPLFRAGEPDPNARPKIMRVHDAPAVPALDGAEDRFSHGELGLRGYEGRFEHRNVLVGSAGLARGRRQGS